MPPSPTWMTYPRTLSLVQVLALAHGFTGCGDDDARADTHVSDAAMSTSHDATLPGPTPTDAAPPRDAGSATMDADTTDGADAARLDAALADDAAAPAFAMRVITTDLAAPWALALGVDGALWVTERTGKRVTRVDVGSGARTTLLQLDDVYQASGQDGLLGLALDPNHSFLYVAYTYDADPGEAVDRRARIARYRHATTLIEPTTLLEGLPASSDHNSGRLVLAPDQTLRYTIGDQGNNQFDRKCLPIRAQELPSQGEVDARDWSKYPGKTLRIALDGSIPGDNPVLAGVRSHVFSYGHRNAQGLAFAQDGSLYASEQGPKTDDELNQIVPGGNYGWPHVAGFRDDRAYAYGNWSAAGDCPQLAYSDYELPVSVPRQLESTFLSPDFTPPVRTFYTVDSDHDFSSALCASNAYLCWPTIAPSSLAVYASGAIPSWTGSFLLTSLKDGAVHRVTTDGNELLFRTINRYRDLAIAADGRTFYVATDPGGVTRALDGSPTDTLEHRGAILEFRAQP
jgi:PQQ-dependent dehydrogenase (s-GDH family)